MIGEEIRQLLSEFRKRLDLLHGSRLKGVYLFGSFARDEADEESDVDVLIVLDRLENYCAEIDYTSEAVSTLSLDYGRSISCVYTSESRWQEDETPNALCVRRKPFCENEIPNLLPGAPTTP